MPYFDRFDICAAHLAIETHYHVSGWLQERPSNRRRMEATHVQLHRMGYRPAVLDTVSRVFYTCATHTRAWEWARELNEGK